MSKIPRKQWTPEEVEFDKYVRLNGSPEQKERVQGRLGLIRMDQQHGQDKMRKMWERIR